MHKIASYPILLLAMLYLHGCSQKVIQVYPGVRQAQSEVAMLRADLGASQNLSSITIRRVNGVDTLHESVPEIEVLPGSLVVRVELLRRASGDDALSDARAFKTITFDAVAGRIYYLRGKMLDGIGRVWVVDDTNAMVSSAETASGQ